MSLGKVIQRGARLPYVIRRNLAFGFPAIFRDALTSIFHPEQWIFFGHGPDTELSLASPVNVLGLVVVLSTGHFFENTLGQVGWAKQPRGCVARPQQDNKQNYSLNHNC